MSTSAPPIPPEAPMTAALMPVPKDWLKVEEQLVSSCDNMVDRS